MQYCGHLLLLDLRIAAFPHKGGSYGVGPRSAQVSGAVWTAQRVQSIISSRFAFLVNVGCQQRIGSEFLRVTQVLRVSYRRNATHRQSLDSKNRSLRLVTARLEGSRSVDGQSCRTLSVHSTHNCSTGSTPTIRINRFRVVVIDSASGTLIAEDRVYKSACGGFLAKVA